MKVYAFDFSSKKPSINNKQYFFFRNGICDLKTCKNENYKTLEELLKLNNDINNDKLIAKNECAWR
jgi:hypothetical protein